MKTIVATILTAIVAFTSDLIFEHKPNYMEIAILYFTIEIFLRQKD